jgi:hypothetical protein
MSQTNNQETYKENMSPNKKNKIEIILIYLELKIKMKMDMLKIILNNKFNKAENQYKLLKKN